MGKKEKKPHAAPNPCKKASESKTVEVPVTEEEPATKST